jgi:hypothetical protein
MMTNVRWRGTRSRGPSSRGGECEMEELKQQGDEQMDIEGNQQMDMGNDDGEHETDNDRVEMTDGHETNDRTVLGSGCRSRRRSHAVMPPLVLDNEDGKTVIRPIDDG